jgi:hypothetical protein
VGALVFDRIYHRQQLAKLAILKISTQYLVQLRIFPPKKLQATDNNNYPVKQTPTLASFPVSAMSTSNNLTYPF